MRPIGPFICPLNFLLESIQLTLDLIMREERISHWFEFCREYDLTSWDGFLGLFQGLYRALNVDGDLKWETLEGESHKTIQRR